MTESDSNSSTSGSVPASESESATAPKRDPAPVLAKLRTSRRSLQLATLDADGQPHCGYAPFVFDESAGDGAFVIFTSQLSVHTRDLLATRQAGIMLIADEAESKEVFARTRASYDCRVEVIERDDDTYSNLLQALQERQGKMIGLLKTLPDFVLFRLVPESGQFVMGFGQAYELQGSALDQFDWKQF